MTGRFRRLLLPALLCLAALLCLGCGAAQGTETDLAPSPTAAPEPTPLPVLKFPGGLHVPADAKTLDLRALRSDQVDEACRCLKQMLAPEEIDLGEERPDGPDWAQIAALMAAAPQAHWQYRFTLYGLPLTLDTEELDLNHIEITDGGALVRAVVACMPRLRWLCMDSCGVENEDMAAIRDAFPQVEVVWRIWFGWTYSVRTDVEKILASKPSMGGELTAEDVAVLRYCTKVRYLDLGHNEMLDDISFIRCMPDLEVCILAMNALTDISPLADCEELEYLELFHNYHLRDLSPLSELHKLRHLNVSNCWELDDISPLYGLDLERLYIGVVTKVPAEQIAEYRRLHPDCEVEDTLWEGSEATWRYTDMSGETFVPRYALLREQLGYETLDYSFFWLDPNY